MNPQDSGRLLLRVGLGVMLLLHGIAKLNHGVGWIVDSVQGYGLPGFLAYGVFVGEVLAPLMIILGFYTRFGAVLIVGNMIVALLLAHSHELLALNGTGGWAIELQAFYLLTALVLLLIGPGRYTLKN